MKESVVGPVMRRVPSLFLGTLIPYCMVLMIMMIRFAIARLSAAPADIIEKEE